MTTQKETHLFVKPPSTLRKMARVICVPTERAADCAAERMIISPVDMR
jgi:hypothetical protein